MKIEVNQQVNVLLEQMIELMRQYQQASLDNSTLAVRKQLRLQIKELQHSIEEVKASQNTQAPQQP